MVVFYGCAELGIFLLACKVAYTNLYISLILRLRFSLILTFLKLGCYL